MPEMGGPESENVNSGGQGQFSGSSGANVDRSASALQYQRFSQNLEATGAALGIGRRVAPDPNALFSHPISAAQFSGGRNAKSTTNEFNEANEENA